MVRAPPSSSSSVWARWPFCSSLGGFSTTSRRFTRLRRVAGPAVDGLLGAGLAGSVLAKTGVDRLPGFEGAGPGQKSWERRSRKRRPSMGPYTREASKLRKGVFAAQQWCRLGGVGEVLDPK